MALNKQKTELSVAAVYVIRFGIDKKPRVAFLKRREPDIFGYDLSLPGGKTLDLLPTACRVKFRAARTEARQELGLVIKDEDLKPAQENPLDITHKGIRMKFYAYMCIDNSHKELFPQETKHTKLEWLDLPTIFKLALTGQIHPCILNGWWWGISAPVTPWRG